MKKIYIVHLLLSCVCVLLTMSSCLKDDVIQDNANDLSSSSVELTIEEAKAFFENYMQSEALTRTQNVQKLKGLGIEFTPLWTKSTNKCTADKAFITTEIDADAKISIRYVEKFGTGKKLYDVSTSQKLVVVKDESGNMMAYVMTIVPDKTYLNGKKKTKPSDIVNGGNKGDFSGMIIYTLPTANFPVRINHYVDGVFVDGASVLDEIKGKSDEISKICSYLANVKIKRGEKYVTRQKGKEDNIMGFQGTYEYLGVIAGIKMWCFTDKNGKTYLMCDYDEDNKPESLWVDPVFVDDEQDRNEPTLPPFNPPHEPSPELPDPTDIPGIGSPNNPKQDDNKEDDEEEKNGEKAIPMTGIKIILSDVSASLGTRCHIVVEPIPKETTDQLAIDQTHLYIQLDGKRMELPAVYNMMKHKESLEGYFDAMYPGYFIISVDAYVSGHELPLKAETSFITLFPSRSEIFEQFETEMLNLWYTSATAGTLHHTYEYSAIAIIDTRYKNISWSFESKQSQPYDYRNTSFPADFPIVDEIPNPTNFTSGGRWIVGYFHTHPSWIGANRKRETGRTLSEQNGNSADIDPDFEIPAWVYDYDSAYITPSEAETISKKNPIPFKSTEYGGERRLLSSAKTTPSPLVKP